MTLEEAYALTAPPDGSKAPVVTVARSGATWTGRVVGVMSQPSLILEDERGRRTAIALDCVIVEERS